MKIKTNLIIAFILISLIPLIFVSFISTHSAQKALKESIKSNFRNLAAEKAGAISLVIKARIDESKLLASTPTVKQAVREANRAYVNKDNEKIQGAITLIDKNWIGSKGKTEKAKQILNNDLSKVLTTYQNNDIEKYGEIFITDKQGAAVAMTKILSDYYQADETWWEHSFNHGRGDTFIDDRGYDTSVGVLVMGIVVPIKENEEVIGILKINYKIKEILNIVSRDSAGETCNISLVRSQKNIIAESRKTTNRELTDTEKKLLNKEVAGYTEGLNEGQKSIKGYAPIDTEIFTRVYSHNAKKGIWGEKWELTRWYLFIDIAQSESFAPIIKLRYLITIIVVIVIFFIIGTALLISRSISIPIAALHKGTEIISAGNLDYKIGIHGKNEIGQLANSFNKMTKDLQKITVSRDYVDNVIESMADTLIVVNPDTKIRTINLATINLLGYRDDELIGNPINMIIAVDKDDQLFKRSGIEDLIKDGFINGVEKNYIAKNGKNIPVLFSGTVMQDDKGKIQGIVCVASDITQRKHLEESLAAEKERLSVTLQSIGDGVIATNNEGNVIMLNKVAQELTGWKADEAPGRALTEVFHIINSETREITENPVDIVLKKKKFVNLTNQTLLIAKDGTEIVIADSAAPILDKENNIIGVVLVFRDVTEFKRLEIEQKEMEIKMMATSKLASLGEMATGVAHEINQPLTYISCFVQNLKRDLKDDLIDKDALQKKLMMSHKQINRINDIILHLRTFGRQDDVKKRQVSIETILDNTLLIMGERIRLKNIEIVKNIEENLPMISANPNQLEQVFINLFQNAMHAFPKNDKLAKIRVDMLLTNSKDSISIIITDNATGIAREKLSRIFEPFFTTKEVGAGTGLGLSIVYGIIKEHNGSIYCESEVNKGTKFLITLPVS